MAPAVTIGRIRIHKAGVVAPEFAVGVTHGSKPPCASAPGQAELQAVVLADRLNRCGTLGAEWHGVQIVDTGRIRDNHRPVQQVGKSRARVTDIEAQTIGDRHVLNRIIKALARVPGFQDQVRRDRPVGAGRELVALYRLHAGLNGRITGIRLGRPEIHILNEPRADTRGGTGARAPGACLPRGSDTEKVERIQRIYALVPVVAAERTAGQTEFHDVEELAIAGIDLQFAVMKHVISAADSRSNLVAPAEGEIGEAGGIESRVFLLVEADAGVYREAGSADGPGILKVQSLVGRFR